MKLFIEKNKKNSSKKNQLPLIFEGDDCIIQASELLHKWVNSEGDFFFVLGEIIGIRNNDYKLNKLIDWSLLEDQKNTSKIDGRYIVISKRNDNTISIWTDYFGRVDIYWTNKC